MSEEQNKEPSEEQNKAPSEGEARVLSDDELKGIVGGGKAPAIVGGSAALTLIDAAVPVDAGVEGVSDNFVGIAPKKESSWGFWQIGL